MTTSYLRILTAISLVCLLMAVPVSAQETNLQTASSSAPVTDTSWYQVERISGDPQVGDFVVGPGRSEIRLEPGQSFVQEITVTNRISDNREFKLEIEDITGTADAAQPVVLLGEETGPYSVKEIISIPEMSFTLDLGERARIPVTVTVPQNAAPGGYYGSILVSTVQSSETTDATTPRSPIIARVGSLFFVTVAGEVLREGEAKSITTLDGKSVYQSGPIEFAVLYENTGTVHTNPYGEISITNMFGEEVGFVELEPWFVLPKSLRSREVSWDREFLFGKYTATARINRGYDDLVDEVETTFWVLPWNLVAITFAVLFVFIFLIRFISKNFEFKRKVTTTKSEE